MTRTALAVDEPDESEPEPDGYVPALSCVQGVPCPPFEEVRLDVAGSAPFGHLVVDGYAADQHVRPISRCPVCQLARREIYPGVAETLGVDKMWFGEEHGWLTYEEAVARDLRDPESPA
jgi:hypothetical protein